MKYLIILSLILSSCSASYHLRKAQKKDPSLFQDTITVEKIDTVFIDVPEVKAFFPVLPDTALTSLVTDQRGQEVRIVYKWNTQTDTVEIQVDCPDAEVIEKVITKQLPPIILEPTLWQRMKWLVVGLVSAMLLIIAFKRVTR